MNFVHEIRMKFAIFDKLGKVHTNSREFVKVMLRMARTVSGNGYYFSKYRQLNFNFFIPCCSVAVQLTICQLLSKSLGGEVLLFLKTDNFTAKAFKN